MKKLLFVISFLLFTTLSFAGENLKKVVFSINGMTCKACPITIKMVLKRQKGVKNVSASLEKKEAVVLFNKDEISIKEMMELLERIGYPAKIKKETL